MNLYDELGIEKDADQSAIKSAYRKEAQSRHPDKGGNKDDFQALQRAYDVLSDEDRRQKYDSTGETGSVQDKKEYARNAIAATLLSLIDQKDVDTTDLIAAVKTSVSAYVVGMNNQKRDIERKIKSREIAVGRLTGPDDGIIQKIIQGDIKSHEQQMARIQVEIDRSNEILAMLAEYSYRVDSTEWTKYGGNQQCQSQWQIPGYNGTNLFHP